MDKRLAGPTVRGDGRASLLRRKPPQPRCFTVVHYQQRRVIKGS
jgi:hypothetical protein